MAYGTVIYDQWYSVPEMDTKFRLELQKLDFNGTVRRVGLRDGNMDHNYQTLNLREPFKNPLLKADLNMFFSMRSSLDEAILEDVFNSPPRTFRIVKYMDDGLDWIGYVDSHQIEYPRSPGPILGTLRARDLDELKGMDYGLQDGRGRIIKVLAEILGLLEYDLPIRTYTRWKEGDMLDEEDFLHERYIDRFALRIYGRSSGEPDESIPALEALEMVLKSFKLFVIQSDGYWNLFQLSALENANEILEFEYDAEGEPEYLET